MIEYSENQIKANWTQTEKAKFIEQLIEKLDAKIFTEKEFALAVSEISYKIKQEDAIGALLALQPFIALAKVFEIGYPEQDFERPDFLFLPKSISASFVDGRKVVVQYNSKIQRIIPIN